MADYRNLIDGEMVDNGEWLEVLNPANEQVVGRVPACEAPTSRHESSDPHDRGGGGAVRRPRDVPGQPVVQLEAAGSGEVAGAAGGRDERRDG